MQIVIHTTDRSDCFPLIVTHSLIAEVLDTRWRKIWKRMWAKTRRYCSDPNDLMFFMCGLAWLKRIYAQVQTHEYTYCAIRSRRRMS